MVATGSYNHAVRTVGIKVLKNKLSEYVRLAAQGETVLISDRDKVVAELVPPRAGRTIEVADAVLADLVRSGLATPPLLPPGPPPEPPARTSTLAEILAEQDTDRADR